MTVLDNYLFFKGLIQVAGAFVHLQKQFLHPEHPKHRPRLRPAVRLPGSRPEPRYTAGHERPTDRPPR